MARHSTGQHNYRIAPGLLIGILMVVLLIAGFFGWRALRDSNATDSATAPAECINGELPLPIYETTPGLITLSIQKWNDTHPIVRDHCITATSVPSVDQAALIVGLNKEDIDNALAGSTRTSSEIPAENALPVGVELKDGIEQLPPPDQATYPQGTSPGSALALTKGNIQLARDLMARDNELSIQNSAEHNPPAIAITENLPGYQLAETGYSARAMALVLAAQQTEHSEEQYRAAQALHDYLKEQSLEQGEALLDLGELTRPKPPAEQPH